MLTQIAQLSLQRMCNRSVNGKINPPRPSSVEGHDDWTLISGSFYRIKDDRLHHFMRKLAICQLQLSEYDSAEMEDLGNMSIRRIFNK